MKTVLFSYSIHSSNIISYMWHANILFSNRTLNWHELFYMFLLCMFRYRSTQLIFVKESLQGMHVFSYPQLQFIFIIYLEFPLLIAQTQTIFSIMVGWDGSDCVVQTRSSLPGSLPLVSSVMKVIIGLSIDMILLCKKILHPEQDRVLTIRECARLQGFHDYYQFCGDIKDR